MPADDLVARRVVVHGHVQGVFFRAGTRSEATRLGVSGWVRNTPQGTVEAHLEGTESDVRSVITWMRAGGPPGARVTAVDETRVDPRHFTAFDIVYR